MFQYAGKEVTVIVLTAKAHGPRQVGLCCYGLCTAASCAGLLLKSFELAFVYDRKVSHFKFVQKD